VLVVGFACWFAWLLDFENPYCRFGKRSIPRAGGRKEALDLVAV